MAGRRRSAFDDDGFHFDPEEAAANALNEVREERGRERLQTQTGQMTFRQWADQVPEERGPLDFDRFRFQRELYDEHSADDREHVYQKATQVGVSTQSLRWALFHADARQRVVLYTFPTDDELTDFSRQRIGPVIRGSEHLLSRMRAGAVNNVGQKQIGTGGWIYFRGTNKPIDSIPADVVVFDEYDTSDQANIEASERRVTGPMSAGLIRRVGVPSIPGFGISSLYEGSDQRVWTVKCTACGTWNPMRGLEAFEQNVDQDALELVCRAGRCRRPIDVRLGEWVAAYPEREVRGYHIPKMLIPGKRTLGLVVANSRKTKDYQRTAWFTRDLGEPYAPAEGRLSREQVEACVRPELRPQNPRIAAPTHAIRFMGVDVASVRAFNVSIEEAIDENTGKKIWVGEIEDDPAWGSAFVQLCRIIDALGINMIGIDDSPEGRLSIALARRYPGRVYRIGFFTPGPQQKKAPAPWTVDDVEQYVSLWRTRAYDATFERFRAQRVLLPPLELLPADYASHLGNLYRQKTEASRTGADGVKVGTGSIRVDYVKTGPEDYAQAEAYCLAAVELYWRAVGLNLATGQAPVSLVDQMNDPYDPSEDLPAVEDDPDVYRPGME